MAEVKKADIPVVADFMPEFWRLIKRYYLVEDRNEYWRDFVSECDDIYKRFPDKLCEIFLVSYGSYLEKKYYEKYGKKDKK